MKSERAEFKLVRGTLGSRPCERRLEEILIELGNSWVAHKATSRIQDVRERVQDIVKSNLSPSTKRYLLHLVKADHITRWDNTRDNDNQIPEKVYSFTCNVINAIVESAFKESGG